MKVALNDFVRRQTPSSPYSHFKQGDMGSLLKRVQEGYDHAFANFEHPPKPEQGVLKIWLDPEGFYTPVVDLRDYHEGEYELHATFKARQKGENPFVKVRAIAPKQPATYVKAILYSHNRLKVDNENSTDASWEVISVNAVNQLDEELPTPVAMARNFLGLIGGTKTDYTAREFAQAIMYWSTRVMAQPDK